MSDTEDEIEKKVGEPEQKEMNEPKMKAAKEAKVDKRKKPKTEKQMEAWNKAIEARTANRLKRAEERDNLYKEKLAKQEVKIAKKEKKIENKIRKEIADKLLETDTEDELEEIPLPKIVKKKKTKVVYVDSDDEEIDNKAPIVIINKFDKKEKEVVKEPVKPKIRFL
jgi:hypothetical protein